MLNIYQIKLDFLWFFNRFPMILARLRWDRKIIWIYLMPGDNWCIRFTRLIIIQWSTKKRVFLFIITFVHPMLYNIRIGTIMICRLVSVAIGITLTQLFTSRVTISIAFYTLPTVFWRASLILVFQMYVSCIWVCKMSRIIFIIMIILDSVWSDLHIIALLLFSWSLVFIRHILNFLNLHCLLAFLPVFSLIFYHCIFYISFGISRRWWTSPQ